MKLEIHSCQLDKIITTADFGYKMTFALGETGKEAVAKSLLFRGKELKIIIEEVE